MNKKEILALLNREYPVRFLRMKPLRDGPSYTCVVYSGKGKYILKLYRTVLAARGMQAVEIMEYLYTQGFAVPEIIKTNTGNRYFCFGDDGQIGVLFAYVGGTEPDVTRDTEHIGRLVARMHNLMQDYPGGLIPLGKEYFIDYYIAKLQGKGYPKKRRNSF